MEKATSKRKTLKNNYVIYLLLSYASVLLVPVIVIAIGITTLFYMYSRQVKQSDIDKIDHSIQLIDDQLTSVTYMVSSIARNTEVIAVSEAELDKAGLRQYSEAIQALQNITRYNSPGLEDNFYIYFRKTDSVIYDSTLYRAGLFEQYLTDWGIGREEWYERIVSSDITYGKFIMSGSGTLQYVQPLSSGVISRDNGGVAVFVINNEKLNDYFSAMGEFGDYALYITDRKSTLLFREDSDGERSADFSQTANPFPDVDDDNIIHRVSSYNGWNYYLILPDGAIYEKMAIVYAAGIVMGILALLVTFGIANRSVRIGRPIDEVFSMLDKGDVEKRSPEKFSEIVAGIVNSNEQLREELEKNKPMQRKLLLHYLLSLDVVSPREIRLMAENVGVNIDYECFCIASVNFYANNDFNEIDEQTLSDIKVIEQALLRRIEEKVGENVWCYQRNYHSRLFIFGGIQPEEVKTLAEELRVWLEEVFNTESNWGISRGCDDILMIWKICEEAEMAQEHCGLQDRVVRYTTEMEDRRNVYFPDSAGERIAGGVRSGNFQTVKEILDIVFEENLKNRTATRSNLMKLNKKLTGLLRELRPQDDATAEQVERINAAAASPERFSGEYYQAVLDAFSAQCNAFNQEKNFQKIQLVNGIKEYILDNWQNAELGLPMVSKIFQLSEGYVSTLFKEQTGINFVSYVENVRLEHACDLLRTTQMSVDEIGAAVGYNSVQSFRRAFKRVYNENPNSYRKNAQ